MNKTLILLVTAIWISGCSTSEPLKKMQTNGQSTAELMRNHSLQQKTSPAPGRSMHDYNYTQHMRTSLNEMDMLFPRLPNPTLVMFVYPHMSQAGVPVPGYTTAFPLFDSVEYALPGEMPIQQQELR